MAIGLLALTEAVVPVGVPGDVLMLVIGERAAAGAARLGRVRGLVEQRGGRGLAVGRATPGLRTLTVVVASTAGLSPTRALPALLLGSTVFVQAHFVLGYLFGPAVLDVFERTLPVALAVAGLLLVVAAIVWLPRRGRGGGAQAFEEAGCPVCKVVGAVGDRLLARPASPPPR